MTIEHLQIRDIERQRRLFEQQIEELHSCKMKIKKKYGGGRRRSGDV